ncbi:solute carrier family 25 (mitochondrial carnitine/acylcarnitine transporter), member 20/29 [Entomortierella parvispora]|uniref:Mitochondrial basic amino acids transporter n=1 Tax=Entomortierella parvispora TaxID=205924 RepID=A0A9P3HAZ4_9FUNG|nr:solute carrier family 25 (mitochondrial carnitine/acylcarnitine transporter), member 20/29 [Entomortierella parvispora]
MLDCDENIALLQEQSNGNDWTSNFVAGTIGGVAGLCVGHPWDTVKVRLQSKELAAKYSGTWNCFSTILRQEKVKGLYKGMASPMVGVALVNALLFGVYGFFMDIQMKNPGDDPTLMQIFLAGTGSGVVNSFISCPMELSKIRLQNQQGPVGAGGAAPGTAFYKGPMDCFKQTYRQGGLRACYRGLWSTILRETSYGPYFLSYEIFCRALTPEGQRTQDLSSGRLVVAGGFAGIAGWMSTYPTDVIKTRIQAQHDSTPKALQFRGVWDCTKQLYREEGFRVFFRGANATVIRAFPCNAATFLVYSMAMRAMMPSEEEALA